MRRREMKTGTVLGILVTMCLISNTANAGIEWAGAGGACSLGQNNDSLAQTNSDGSLGFKLNASGTFYATCTPYIHDGDTVEHFYILAGGDGDGAGSNFSVAVQFCTYNVTTQTSTCSYSGTTDGSGDQRMLVEMTDFTFDMDNLVAYFYVTLKRAATPAYYPYLLGIQLY
jgi:hypothetical protein